MALSRSSRGIAVCTLLAAALAGNAFGQAFYATNGLEYAIIGALPGDQAHPQIALSATNGYIVWEDNRTDPYGLGISARRLDASFSGAYSTFRVNQIGTNHQQNPQLTMLKNGGVAFVWQGGRQGYQQIYARFLSRSNVWVTGDILVNTSYTNRSKLNPVIITLADGNVVVVWGSMNQNSANSLQDVYAQRLSPTGQKLGPEFLVNQFTSYNQRNPVVASLANGRFVVAWVSEQQRSGSVDNSDPNYIYSAGTSPSVDIYARLFTTNGLPAGSEFLVNTSTNICSSPVIATDVNGGFMIAWAQKDLVYQNNSWDIYARHFTAGAVGALTFRVNSTTYGDQYTPAISSVGTDYFVLWTSLGQDGSREGVYGQFLRSDGSLVGSELRINTTTVSQQIQPTVASDKSGRFLVAWSSFTGVAYGFDLFAQRYASTTQPLGAPDAPTVTALSSNALGLTWAPIAGMNLANYEVYADGATAATAVVTNTSWTMTNVAPSSIHSFKLAYVLVDGRRSPLSASASGRTYSANPTWGGIPQEWMSHYFGSDILSWPSPYADSDGDGVSNLNEFLAGTDPTDPNSVLRIRLEPTSQGMFLNWNTQPGLVYQVQSSVNLSIWSNVGSPRFAAGSNDSLYVNGGNSGYFRVLRVR